MSAQTSRRAGILVPLFSIPSAGSWGIGEIPDLPRLARWCERAGVSVIQLLPIHELPSEETSPYSALTAMAIDPQFISVAHTPEFVAAGGESSLEAEDLAELAEVRRSPRIDYRLVRSLKQRVLRRCFEHFVEHDQRRGTPRFERFRAFVEQEAWWLHDYAVFRALHESHGHQPWPTWPVDVRERQSTALEAAQQHLADQIGFRQYLQWIAAEQWREARQACGPVQVFGDLPFVVGVDSADVWSRQDEFRLDVSVGVPPDAFSDTGQDWKLPLYRWEILAERDFAWLRARARRYAALYDGYRIDHLVGFYRTYYRPLDGSPAAFLPAEQPAQERLGEQVLDVFRASGAHVIAEDLGVIPDFVRQSLLRLQMPGYKVFRWERDWHAPGQPFLDPVGYPSCSVATSGTHDTEPMVVWWEAASVDERRAALAIPSVRTHVPEGQAEAAVMTGTLDPTVHAALLESLYSAGSDLVILPVGDLFIWRDRINHPGTVGPANWTWKLPWPVEHLTEEPLAVAVAAGLRQMGERYRR